MHCVEGTVAFGRLGRQVLAKRHRRHACGRLPICCGWAAALRRHDLLQRLLDELLQLGGRAGERCFYRLLRLLRGSFCFRRLACGLPRGGALFVGFDDVLEGRQVL